MANTLQVLVRYDPKTKELIKVWAKYKIGIFILA